MPGSVFLSNAQVNAGTVVEMRSRGLRWNQDIFVATPTIPSKSGVPPFELDYMGVDTPGIELDGLIDLTTAIPANTITMRLLEQFAQATGPSWYQDQYFVVSGTQRSIFSTGSVGVFPRSISAQVGERDQQSITYRMVLIITSGT